MEECSFYARGLEGPHIRERTGGLQRKIPELASYNRCCSSLKTSAAQASSMPEIPDVVVYIESLQARVLGQVLERVRLASPFLLRSVEPPPAAVAGKKVLGFRRLGERIVFCLEADLFLVLHLMIAGRLHWKPRGAKLQRKVGLAAFDFPAGTLTLTEAGTKKRASLYVVRGETGLA